MSEELKSAREFAEQVCNTVYVPGVGMVALNLIAVTDLILSRDKLIEEAALRKAAADRPNVMGAKPVCLDCNAAGIINCSHFDNCAGKWVYKPSAEHDREIERKALLAEAETLEQERCEIARITVAIKKALQSYEWLMEGRGSYEWNDDRWHDEFEHACHNIRLELEPLEKIGADLSNRAPAASTSSDSVDHLSKIEPDEIDLERDVRKPASSVSGTKEGKEAK